MPTAKQEDWPTSPANYDVMPTSELKHYFLKHRGDRAALQAYLDRINQHPLMVNVSQAINQTAHQDGQVVESSLVVLHPIAWSTYQALLADLGEHRAARLAYDRGTLEIKMPSTLHELLNRLLERIITTLTEELGMSILSLGSTRFDFEALEQGVEPDSCFYIQNAEQVNFDELMPPQNVPPDLVIEVDITSSSKSRLKIYKAMGVPEIWCYNREGIAILRLQDSEYVAREASPTFPLLSTKALESLLEKGKQSRNHNPLIAEFRTWLRDQQNMPSC